MKKERKTIRTVIKVRYVAFPLLCVLVALDGPLPWKQMEW